MAGADLQVQATLNGTTTLTTTGLSLANSGSLTLDLNGQNTTAAPLSAGALSTSGTVSLNLLNGGALLAGTHPLIGYTSSSGGGTFAGSPYTLGPRTSGTLIDNGTSALSLVVTGDRPVWTGADNGNWIAGTTGANGDWQLQTAATATDYISGDNVLFDDSATGLTSINISSANVSPAAVTFNDSFKNYTISSSGGFGITGTGSLTKNGTGTVTVTTANSFSGPVILNGGTLAASLSGNPTSGAFTSVSSITINSGTLTTSENGLFGNTGSNESPIIVNAGGILTSSSAAATSHLGLVTLAGGTLTFPGTPSGDGLTFGSYALDGGLNAGGTSTTSVISARVWR